MVIAGDKNFYPSTCRPDEIPQLDYQFECLLASHRKFHRNEDQKLLIETWTFTVHAHGTFYKDAKKLRRTSGEHYLYHVLKVATYLAEWGMDSIAISAGLLHDVVEDTFVPLAAIEKRFGKEIADIVLGLTEIRKKNDHDKENKDTPTIRRIIKHTIKHDRVPIIKLADRLHNMQTLGPVAELKPHKARDKAQETLNVYCPIAHALGFAKVKRELEDLAFRFTDPERCIKVDATVKKIKPEATKHGEELAKLIQDLAISKSITASVVPSVKRTASVIKYLDHKSMTLQDIWKIKNIIKVLVVCEVDDPDQCRTLQGKIGDFPLYDNSRDGFKSSRSNGFSALLEWRFRETESGVRPFEVQIYTKDSYETSEFGIVVCKYRHAKDDTWFVNHKLVWEAFKDQLKSLSNIRDDREFIASIASAFDQHEIYVYHKGKKVHLPMNSTPIDLAYKLDARTAHKLASCTINGETASISTPLRLFNRIELRIVRDVTATEEWLGWVRTPVARNKLKQLFEKRNVGRPHLDSEM